MADIDFDTLEKLMEDGDDVGVQLEDEKIEISLKEGSVGESSRRSRERSSRDRGREGKVRSRDRSRDRERDREREKERKRLLDEKEREREERREKERVDRLKREEERRLRDEEEKRKREEAEARRDDMTVLVLNLNLKADEKELYVFFSKGAGKVRDIQLIRDGRSGKSKGVAYVEFYTQEGLLKALSLSGQSFMNQLMKVQSSQAEKNRAAKAAKEQEAKLHRSDGPFRLYVGGLTDRLSYITEEELRTVFKPFGEVEAVEVHREMPSGRCKGYAFVQMAKTAEAKEALVALNGYQLANQPIKVGLATNPFGQGGTCLSELQLKMQEGLLMGLDPVEMQRTLLEQYTKGLVGPQCSSPQDTAELLQALVASSGVCAPETALLLQQGRLDMSQGASGECGSTTVIKLLHAFNSSGVELDKALTEEPSFYRDLSEDISEEAGKFGNVVGVWINRDIPDGSVWLKFESTDAGANAANGLNGRWFGGNRIFVEFVSEESWQASITEHPM
eukprot:GHVR01172185.1.p1 GENE.GHVR01172185.1~~GHVR01172185.1.p1  ORF type:complete len:506 (+),score=148.89 GHVR01172185.1:1229-2746(+)